MQIRSPFFAARAGVVWTGRSQKHVGFYLNFQLMPGSFIGTDPQVKSGQMVRLLAADQRRSPYAPDVPSMADLKFEGNFPGDMGYHAPAATPRPIIEKLAAAFAKAVQSAEYAEKMKSFGVEPVYKSPTELGEIVRADIAYFTKVIKAAGFI